MPMEIPDPQKVYTTSYNNFRGVDMTNDPTNVWSHRSPDAINMMPDEAGRPIKRLGWKTEIPSTDFIDVYNATTGETYEGEFVIYFLKYFTLGGTDYIFVFSNIGLFSYDLDSGVVLLTTDSDCAESGERSFFFEGDGTSAFYIYGAYRMWAFDGTFAEITSDLYVPTVRISTDADGYSGTLNEGFNMLGDMCIEEFVKNDYTYGSYAKCVALYNNVAQGQVSRVKVYGSVSTQFDTEVNVYDESIPVGIRVAPYCVLHSNIQRSPDESPIAILEFGTSYVPLVGQEDSIRVVHPALDVNATPHTDTESVMASLVD